MKSTCQLLIFAIWLFPNFTNAQSTIELFNGKNLDGWYAYESETGKHEKADDIFHVEEQMIRLYGDKTGS